MSILIKNMNVPKNCFACLYESDIYTCKILESASGNLKSGYKCADSGRREDCPLIDIPDEFKGPGKSEPANAWWDGYKAGKIAAKVEL